jgi:hypothetical protein
MLVRVSFVWFDDLQISCDDLFVVLVLDEADVAAYTGKAIDDPRRLNIILTFSLNFFLRMRLFLSGRKNFGDNKGGLNGENPSL